MTRDMRGRIIQESQRDGRCEVDPNIWTTG